VWSSSSVHTRPKNDVDSAVGVGVEPWWELLLGGGQGRECGLGGAGGGGDGGGASGTGRGGGRGSVWEFIHVHSMRGASITCVAG